jgi:hypothetical protein
MPAVNTLDTEPSSNGIVALGATDWPPWVTMSGVEKTIAPAGFAGVTAPITTPIAASGCLLLMRWM